MLSTTTLLILFFEWISVFCTDTVSNGSGLKRPLYLYYGTGNSILPIVHQEIVQSVPGIYGDQDKNRWETLISHRDDYPDDPVMASTDLSTLAASITETSSGAPNLEKKAMISNRQDNSFVGGDASYIMDEGSPVDGLSSGGDTENVGLVPGTVVRDEFHRFVDGITTMYDLATEELEARYGQPRPLVSLFGSATQAPPTAGTPLLVPPQVVTPDQASSTNLIQRFRTIAAAVGSRSSTGARSLNSLPLQDTLSQQPQTVSVGGVTVTGLASQSYQNVVTPSTSYGSGNYQPPSPPYGCGNYQPPTPPYGYGNYQPPTPHYGYPQPYLQSNPVVVVIGGSGGTPTPAPRATATATTGGLRGITSTLIRVGGGAARLLRASAGPKRAALRLTARTLAAPVRIGGRVAYGASRALAGGVRAAGRPAGALLRGSRGPVTALLRGSRGPVTSLLRGVTTSLIGGTRGGAASASSITTPASTASS